MDADGNGFVSQTEFRNAIRKLGLGFSSREIDQLLSKIDTNGDGKISYPEFAANFEDPSGLEQTLATRSKVRMGQLKELMILHMTSPNDAFRFFDLERDNTLNFNDFSKLVTQAHKLGNVEVPAYSVMKDLFDHVDIRKDGFVDLQEWQQTFGAVVEGSRSNSIKQNERLPGLTRWENSEEY